MSCFRHEKASTKNFVKSRFFADLCLTGDKKTKSLYFAKNAAVRRSVFLSSQLDKLLLMILIKKFKKIVARIEDLLHIIYEAKKNMTKTKDFFEFVYLLASCMI